MSGHRYDERLDHPVRNYVVRPSPPVRWWRPWPDWSGGALVALVLRGAVLEPVDLPLAFSSSDVIDRQREWSMQPERFWEYVVRIATNGALRL
ncbi:MAG: hypothetical protein K8H88_09705 [Sandaracinaceae bacterium]|nr:hypothetical protein [Sandaracinaceae bacterium]